LGLWYLAIVPIVLVSFGFFALQDEDELKDIQENIEAEAMKKIQTFGDSGEYVEWDLLPLPPKQEYIWQQTEVQVEKEVDGKIILVNETITEKVLTAESEILMELKDRQSGDTRVCKRGHQCDVTGKIILIDPISGLQLKPIMFHYQIICRTSQDPVLICDNYTGLTDTILSYPDSTFKVSFTTNQNDPTGMYELFVRATSKYKDADDQPVQRESSLDIELIA